MSANDSKVKGVWLALLSVLAWIAPFSVNLWIYGFFFVLPFHAFVILGSLIKLWGKGGVRKVFLWLALVLSTSYCAMFFYILVNYKPGPAP